jgi:hypothetical protein
MSESENKVRLQKSEHNGRPAHDVLVNGERVGVVYWRESSKTGFRSGRCVGQVACKAWFYKRVLPDGGLSSEEGYRSSGWGPRFRTRAAAVKELVEGGQP